MRLRIVYVYILIPDSVKQGRQLKVKSILTGNLQLHNTKLYMFSALTWGLAGLFAQPVSSEVFGHDERDTQEWCSEHFWANRPTKNALFAMTDQHGYQQVASCPVNLLPVVVLTCHYAWPTSFVVSTREIDWIVLKERCASDMAAMTCQCFDFGDSLSSYDYRMSVNRLIHTRAT